MVLSVLSDVPATVICLPTGSGSAGSLAETRRFLEKMTQDNANVMYSEESVSRIESGNTVVEEIIATLVHQAPIDWLLPNVKPTNRRVTFPLVAISTFSQALNSSSPPALVSLRLHWDQATILRQIGVLPTSLFCKANNSETVLPILGPKCVDRLRMPLNIAPTMHMTKDAAAAGANDDDDVVVGGRMKKTISAGRKDSMAELLNGTVVADAHIVPSTAGSDMDAVIPVGNQHKNEQQTTLQQAINNPTPATLVRPTSNDIFGVAHENEHYQNPRPSSRVLARPGGAVSDIFGTQSDPSTLNQPIKTGTSCNPIVCDEPITFSSHGRRDPNWSNQPSSSTDSSNTSVTGSRPSSRVIHRPGGPVSGVFGDMDDHEVKYVKPQLKRRDPNWSSLDAGTAGHVDTAVAAAAGAVSRVALNSETGATGRARVAHRADNDIFGEGAPNPVHHINRRDPNARSDDVSSVTMYKTGMVSARDVAESSSHESGVSGRRDHNAMSVQMQERPSSRVLRPPGGGSSFSFN